jgi:hypothetical protein
MADATDGTKGTTNNVGGLGAMNVTSTSADAYGIDATGGTSEDNKATNNVKMNGEIAVKAATSGNVYAIKADAFSSNTVDGSTDISDDAERASRWYWRPGWRHECCQCKCYRKSGYADCVYRRR